jgi:hypothetical protein
MSFTILFILFQGLLCAKAFPLHSATHLAIQPTSSTVVHMGLLDMAKGFLQNRDGDFDKLENSEESGLGPLVLLYNVPEAIDNEELLDMLSDGAPEATKTGISIERINSKSHSLLEKTLEIALLEVMEKKYSQSVDATTHTSAAPQGCPVLLFSGFVNSEMMASYNIVAQEIFAESGAMPACAKAVPNALQKPLRQLLEEISGDHQDAIQLEQLYQGDEQ